jgi:hypothetical protein
MSRSPIARIATTVSGLCVLLGPPAAVAGQMWLPVDAQRSTLRLDVAKPIFDIGPFRDAHLATTVWDATVIVPIEGAPTLFARLAFSVGQIGETGWDATLSKPRLGAIVGRDRGLHGELHVDLPLGREMGGDFATGVGRYTHYEEWERYGPGTWSVGGSVTAESEVSPASFLGARAGATLLMPTQEGIDRDLLGALALFGEAPAGRARFYFELSSFMLFTEPGSSFNDKTWFFAGASVALPNDRFAPEAYVRVPLDESVSAIMSFVLGLRVHLGGPRPRG